MNTFTCYATPRKASKPIDRLVVDAQSREEASAMVHAEHPGVYESVCAWPVRAPRPMRDVCSPRSLSSVGHDSSFGCLVV